VKAKINTSLYITNTFNNYFWCCWWCF